MATSLLLHNKKRLLLSLGAIAFTVLVMFMELGFFNGINDSQSRLPTLFRADLIMMDQRSVHLNRSDRMHRIRLSQALAFEGVVEVVPIYRSMVNMKNPNTGLTKRMFMIAFPADSDPLDLPLYEEYKKELHKPGTLLFDQKSRTVLGKIEIGQDIEINNTPFRVGGFVALGPNFSIDGTVLMSDASWLRTRREAKIAKISYGLIRVAPGTDVMSLRRDMLSRLPEDIILLTPEEMRAREVRYTIKAVPVGVIFGIGLVIGFTIGVIICYQILYNEINDHIPQYATLRAMGFEDGFLHNIVIREALWLSILGFIPGLIGGYLLYYILETATGICMFLTFGRIALVLGLTVSMCICAGLIAVRKVTETDPAALF
jgi:putative ABC transport system permease protein